MAQQATAKGRVFLLLLGIIVGSAGGYFLNWLYPFETLVGPSPLVEDAENLPTLPNGLLQTETVQSRTYASVNGIDVAETDILDMEMNVTIQADSTVELTFIASYFIVMFADFRYGTEFNISLLVDGIAVISSNIFAYRTSLVNVTEYEGGNLAMTCMIPQLSTGEHSFKVVGSSVHPKTDCTLYFSTTGYNFERSMTVNEWAT